MVAGLRGSLDDGGLLKKVEYREILRCGISAVRRDLDTSQSMQMARDPHPPV